MKRPAMLRRAGHTEASTSKSRKQHKHKEAKASTSTYSLLTEFVASKQWKQATEISTY
jgi:hypothetical protein